MIIVDTNVWISHLRAAEPTLVALLDEGRALMHPYVVGELALGAFAARSVVLDELAALPRAALVPHADVVRLIDAAPLHGTGVGYVDAHLLASADAMPGARLWTRDKRLHAVARRLGLAADV